MSKLEQLTAAYDATEKGCDGQWESTGVVVCVTAEGGMDYLLKGLHADGIKNDPNVEFATLAHQMMPVLLKAVELMEQGYEIADGPYAETFRDRVKELREKLK